MLKILFKIKIAIAIFVSNQKQEKYIVIKQVKDLFSKCLAF